MATRIITYLRGDGGTDTIAQQRFTCSIWGARNGADQVHEIVDEEPLGGPRPRLRAAIEAVEGGEADAVVVASLDRIDADMAALVRVLERAAVVAVRDDLDTRDPWSHTMALRVLRAVARIEAQR